MLREWAKSVHPSPSLAEGSSNCDGDGIDSLVSPGVPRQGDVDTTKLAVDVDHASSPQSFQGLETLQIHVI